MTDPSAAGEPPRQLEGFARVSLQPGAQVWQPQSDGALLNPQSGKCLDDTGFSTTPGTQVQIWSCTGAANQSWVQP